MVARYTVDTSAPRNEEIIEEVNQEINDNPEASLANRSHLGRVTFKDGQMETNADMGPTKGDSSKVSDPSDAAGILSTARSPIGGLRGQLTPDTLVTYQGQTMSLKVAQHLGLVTCQNGVYSEVASGTPETGSAQAAPAQAPRKTFEEGLREGVANELKVGNPAKDETAEGDAKSDADESEPEMLSDEAESSIEDFYSKGNDFAEGVAAMVMKNNGDLDPHDIGAIATRMEMDPEEAQAKLDGIMESFTKQAATAVSKLYAGDPQEVFDWARENMSKQELAEVYQRQFRGDLSGYREMTLRFARSVAPDVEDVRKAGWKVFEKNGKTMVYKKGHGEMTLENANRLGLV